MNKTGVFICLTGLLLLIHTRINAQGYVENALQFSMNWSGGSARILGAGGAQVSLGGDFSSALSNPAGLGMYNRSEFTISPAINGYNADADYFGNKVKSSKSVFNIPGLSYVQHASSGKSGFLGGSFGISLTRTNDFHNVTHYKGYNPNSSIVDYFIDQADTDDPSQFDEGAYNYNTLTGLAYYTWLISPLSAWDPNDPVDLYGTELSPGSYPDQEETIETKGASNQWSISYGGNVEDRFFFGGGLGIATLRYKSTKFLSESFSTDPALDGLGIQESVEIDGSGVNFTIGAIARVTDFMQIGASLVTPTYYKLTSNYYSEMSAYWNNYTFDYYDDNGDPASVFLQNETASLDQGGLINDYSFSTPLKFTAGVTFITKYGFISADVESLNPGKSRYGSNIAGITFSPENDVIQDSYTSVTNVRVGGEFRYDKWRVRIGGGKNGNPYRNSNIRYDSRYLSAGVGIRTKTYFVDFALVSRSNESYYFPYIFSDGYADPVKVDTKTNSFVFTFGFSL